MYQKECREKVIFNIENPGNRLIVSPCGSGKSIIIAKTAAQIFKEMGEKTIIMHPSKELLLQNKSKLEQIDPTINISIYSASCRKKELSDIVFATLGSITNCASEIKKRGYKYCLIDEPHYKFPTRESSMFMKFASQIGFRNVIGYTATPFILKSYRTRRRTYTRLNMMTFGINPFYKDISHVVQIKDISNEYWCKTIYEEWPFDESNLFYVNGYDEYTTVSINESVNKNNVNIAVFKRLCDIIRVRKSIIVFCNSIETCNILSETINRKFGYVSEAISSETRPSERERMITAFKAGVINILFSVNILAIGFDHPLVDCVIVATPTMSLQKWYQQAGRAVRPAKEKTDALIIDFCGNVRRFGKIEDLTIEHINGWGWETFSGDICLTNCEFGKYKSRNSIYETIKYNEKIEDISKQLERAKK